MNKYALTLPLVLLAAFLGYFGSRLQVEHVLAIVTVTTVLALIAGFLLLKRQKDEGEKN